MKRRRVPIGKQGPVFGGMWGGSSRGPWGSSASGRRPLQHPLPRSRARVHHVLALRSIQDAFGVPSYLCTGRRPRFGRATFFLFRSFFGFERFREHFREQTVTTRT